MRVRNVPVVMCVFFLLSLPFFSLRACVVTGERYTPVSFVLRESILARAISSPCRFRFASPSLPGALKFSLL